MASMSRASEIAHNVWLGSTADVRSGVPGMDKDWGVVIEASDSAPMPAPETLYEMVEVVDQLPSEQLYIDFPSSGTISPSNWSRHDVDGLIGACKWIYAIANGVYMEDEEHDSDGDHNMASPRESRKVLIHCTDGYTETSLLALAYLMYSEVLPVHEAWIKLHTDKGRNFFAYDKDLNFLRYIESNMLDAAARNRKHSVRPTAELAKKGPPEWLYRMDGSLPSRVLPYMYLGNLLHANNCGLLQALGIKRVLSIGEEVTWSKDEKDGFGESRVMAVKDLQDNGCDSLECRFRRCLEFIGWPDAW